MLHPLQIQQAFWVNVEILQYHNTTHFQTHLLSSIAAKKWKEF